MISILCPTRKRPELFKRMVDSARETAAGRIQIVCYIDNDDLETYKAIEPLCVSVVCGPRKVLTQCWNDCICLAEGDIFLQGNDDIIFRTQGWDRIVEEEFSKFGDSVLMVHGDDGSGIKRNFGTHPFVHRKWVETIGYFIAPYFSSDYGDTWLNDLANAVGRRRELPFLIEHMHYIFNKAEVDQTTMERLQRHQSDNVSHLYRALVPLRNLDIRKLRRQMERKEKVKPKWAILILTQNSRCAFLERISKSLYAQIEPYEDVELRVRICDRSMDLGANRQAMIDECDAEYINFVDDDDLVSPQYVSTIYPLLDGVDQVGFRLQCYVDGVPLLPTFHSITHGGWSQDENGYYRDYSHLNPIRRELALRVRLEGGFGEDHRWADRMRELGVVKTEHYIPDIMYRYYSRSKKEDTSW